MSSRYRVAGQRRMPGRGFETHAVWRGIGCLLMLIVPVTSWILAVATVQLAVFRGWPMPYQLMGYPVLPNELWGVRVLWPVLGFIQGQQNLYAILGLTVAYVIIGSALLSFGYAAAYRFFGPPRYGPLDAPPPNIRVGRYKR